MPQAAQRSITSKRVPPAATVDPVVEMAQELGRLWTLNDTLDRRDDYAAKRGADDCWEKICTTQDYITTVQARSLPGALVHANLLSAMLDQLNPEIHSPQESVELKKTLCRAERAIYSIVTVLREHSCGVDPIGRVYCPDRLSPWNEPKL
jgi:hypothetical protein